MGNVYKTGTNNLLKTWLKSSEIGAAYTKKKDNTTIRVMIDRKQNFLVHTAIADAMSLLYDLRHYQCENTGIAQESHGYVFTVPIVRNKT